jgi:hypothetical protein
MQRRAAAVSAVVFLLLAAGSYAYIGVAEEPDISVEGEHTLEPGGSFTGSDGTTYHATGFGDGSATVYTVVEASTYTQSWTNNSTVSYDGVEFRVHIPNTSSPQEVTLRETLDVSGILQNDSAVENETITREDGEEYVVYRANGSTVPLSEYLPEPREETFVLDQQFTYEGNQTTVSTIEVSAATLTWTAPRNVTNSLSEGTNVTLDQKYVAHFPADSNSVVLSTNFEAYQHDVERQSYFTERVNGLWAVAILGALTAIFLLAMAYMPSRY